ncbi:ATP-binding protein [Haliscomenobacter hydrossis]|uniref:AAA-ATPase n=1 Tax=Haliscomenobacter hydrossis (strain ATCC 27775 / DSM 1100 / LMG 10767 / O) TaxID=760192 RepID=F4KS40_HALH1|nr:ATP-binding protein [Haliscomenobacter hydrossis]AEE52285.1 AAA-ATPase [Haliscomenobacter hydrossis DSM 1100]
MAQDLPLGLQDFRKIIENDFKYIDKTRYIYEMCRTPGAYFLSRPRRFGKSITLAVLQELYLGSRDLFKGLWIQDHWDWNRTHPVLRISFSALGFQEIGLKAALEQELKQIALSKRIQLKTIGVASMFKEMIVELAKKNKVVVLIDEYDAPIINYLGKEIEKAYENRELLKSFYTVLKDLDSHLEFVFITGVSKFSKVGIFSGMNNLTDLSMHPQYATMLGYTQQELESNFMEELETTATQLLINPTKLLDQLRWWYNGYRFHLDAQRVYNPVSVNNFFDRKEFKNFWFETGTPTFLINLLKQEGIYKFTNDPQPEQSFDTFELENLNVYGLLYQTGYLTIKTRNPFGLYELDYPNHEVEYAMNGYLFEAFSGLRYGEGLPLVFKLETLLRNQNLEQAIQVLQGMFKGIPYQLHEHYPEKFFHAAIHLLFTYMGLSVHSEVCTADGRADAVVETPTHIYLFEFKLDQSADVALNQIRQKQYYQAFWQKGKPVLGVGVNFSSTIKNIEDWKLEQLG